jgi:hypothetical protein
MIDMNEYSSYKWESDNGGDFSSSAFSSYRDKVYLWDKFFKNFK